MNLKVVFLCSLMLAFFSSKITAIELKSLNVDGKSVILVQGDFVDGDAAKFRNAISQIGKIDEIWFNSPGGALTEGLEIGRYIRSRKLATKVPHDAVCASTCTFAFLGGVLREIEYGGKYGVHMFSAWCGDQNKSILAKGIATTLKTRGCNVNSVIEIGRASCRERVCQYV